MRIPESELRELLVASGATMDEAAHKEFSRWLNARALHVRESSAMNVFAAIGAWFAAMFLMSFVFAVLAFNEKVGAVICGLALMGVALPLLRANAMFLNQMALAFAIAGNALLVTGVTLLLGDPPEIAVALLAHLIVAALAYEFFAHAAYRFLATGAAWLLAFTWCLDDAANGVNLVFVAQVALAGAPLFHRRLAPRYLPLLYATVIALAVEMLLLQIMLQFSFMDDSLQDLTLVPARIAFAVALLALLARLAACQVLRGIPVAIAAALVLALATFTSAGVLLGIALLAVAYATADRRLGVTAAAFLPAFLFLYYYALDITLADKSLVLIASGALLLVARAALSYRKPAA